MELYQILDGSVVSSRFSAQGAFDTKSSEDRYVQFVLDSLPISENDIFVDVGCGVGKVLSMIHSHCRARIIGVEIDPIIADIARDRVKDMDNVEVLTNNILDCKDVIQDATILYLYNPFNADVLDCFLAMVGKLCRKDVHIVYVNDIFKHVFYNHNLQLTSCIRFTREGKTDLEVSVWGKQ